MDGRASGSRSPRSERRVTLQTRRDRMEAQHPCGSVLIPVLSRDRSVSLDLTKEGSPGEPEQAAASDPFVAGGERRFAWEIPHILGIGSFSADGDQGA